MLRLIGEGLTNRQIGERMGLAEKTVKNYTSHLLAKLGLERRTQAAILATELAGPRSAAEPVSRASGTVQLTSVPESAAGRAQPPAPALGAVGQVGQPAAHRDRRQPAAVVGDHDGDRLGHGHRDGQPAGVRRAAPRW